MRTGHLVCQGLRKITPDRRRRRRKNPASSAVSFLSVSFLPAWFESVWLLSAWFKSASLPVRLPVLDGDVTVLDGPNE